MNTQQENIIVDSCQYTPVYLLQNTGAIQGRPYIVTQANVEDPKPVSDNLKRYYESSGILENNIVNNAPSVSKPRILKKQDSKLVGNNLKLASFLLPKGIQENNLNKQCLPLNNVVLKQVGGNLNTVPKVEVVSANVLNTAPKMEIVTTNVVNTSPTVELLAKNVINNAPKVEILSPNVVNNIPKLELVTTNIVNKNNVSNKVELVSTNVNCNAVPKLEVDRKIVKLKNFPNALRSQRENRPKMKPREDSPNPNPSATKHTSVQLLKLGETYHSLNQLDDEQMKMVNQALKIFSNPEKTSMEPTYDPVTNTRFIYKVVSPRDLTVVGKNKMKKEETIHVKKEPRKIIEEEEPDPEPPTEVKMTRSGRKVKFPKQIIPEANPQKPRRKPIFNSVVTCVHCSAEFCSLYRLQKHYDNHPTHLPAKVHSNLFQCLLAIVKSGAEEDRTNIFIQQLEELIDKLKSLLPCLLEMDGNDGETCTVNDEIAQLFGLNPGNYNINIDALSCVKDKVGNCKHYPPHQKIYFHSELNKPSQLWLSKHNEEIANMNNEPDDCARINAVKRPTPNKRPRNNKQQKTSKLGAKAKKMKLVSSTSCAVSDTSEAGIDMDELANFTTPKDENVIDGPPKSLSILDDMDIVSENCIQQLMNERKGTTITEVPKKTKSAPAHFNLSTLNNQSAINMQPKSLSVLDQIEIVGKNCFQEPIVKEHQTNINEPPKKGKGHTQFHSAHFDIRSSPIKSSSAATFRKFQINPETLGKYEVQIIRPLDLDNSQQQTGPQTQESAIQTPPALEPEPDPVPEEPEDLHCIFRDDIIALTCKDPNDIPNDLAFQATKDWICSGLNAITEKSDDNFMKTNSIDESFIRSNSLIEPLHLKEESIDRLPIMNNLTSNDPLSENDNRLLSNQSSVMNFLDSLGSECLSYPETEIRNNAVDFQLDLFSFSNT